MFYRGEAIKVVSPCPRKPTYTATSCKKKRNKYLFHNDDNATMPQRHCVVCDDE